MLFGFIIPRNSLYPQQKSIICKDIVNNRLGGEL